MPPTSESPFKRDEPAGSSAKWMYMAGVSASIWAASSAWSMLRQFDLEWDTLWQITGVALQVALVLLLFRAAAAASRCRHHRSFDLMAAAVRCQRPFWALLTVAGAIGSFVLALSALTTRERNKFIQRWIDEEPARAAAAASAKSSTP